jgi:single-stranded-DNA-specific exonuclease
LSGIPADGSGERGILSPPPPRWVLSSSPDPSRVEALETALGLPGPLCALLVARGYDEIDAAKAFLRPMLSELHPPETLPDLPLAVTRVLSAIQNKEIILVHGDYDVDGMAGTALLTRWLEKLGGRVVPFVPHRLRDGYDLGDAGLKAAVSAGAALLVTVDCGILAHGAVEEARTLGLDVIVTDHHAPGEDLPHALAVLNPARADSLYPNPDLCGTGVAFKLCQGLARAKGIGEEELHPFLDLVGLATVADLVPLREENRVLARYGLKALGRTRNFGLQALMAEAGVSPEGVSAGTVGFGLAPRLNALGRLGEPQDGLRLLLTDDWDEARRLARLAEEVNRKRQDTDRRTQEEALELLAQSFDPERDFGVVLASEDWHPGVVGIVASKVAERIHRPVVLIALEGDRGRGSARSIPDYHLLEGIRACGSHLERFGGHRQAAGMEIRRDRIPGFREAFNAEARRILGNRDLRPTVQVEVEVPLEEMSQELFRYLQYLGPHGIGNPGPTFLSRGVSLSGPARIVGTEHLKLRLRQGRTHLEAIGFHLARRVSPQALGTGPMDVVFQLHENEFRGVRQLQARLKDIRRSDPPSPQNRTDP